MATIPRPWNKDNPYVEGDMLIEGDLRVNGAITAIGAIDASAAPINFYRDVENLTASTKTLTTDDSGTLYRLNRAAGVAVALPAIATADIGTWFEFVVETTVTSNGYIITAQTGDLLLASGLVTNVDTDSTNALAYYAPDGSDDLITTLNGTTTGGLIKSRLRYVAVSATGWYVEGIVFASGTVATPFS